MEECLDRSFVSILIVTSGYLLNCVITAQELSRAGSFEEIVMNCACF